MVLHCTILAVAVLGAIVVLLATGAHWASAVMIPCAAGLWIAISRAGTLGRRRGSIAARREARSSARELAGQEAGIVRSLRAILDRVDAPILVFDPAGEIVHANASSATLLGRRADELVGRAISDLFSQSALVACCERAVGGVPSRARVTLAILESPRTFDASAIPLQASEWPWAVLTLQDVTDLATANRLKTDFAANASHELRTPVASIKGAAETLADADDDPALRERLLSIIARNATRLEELLADLLELSRLESQDAQPPAERFGVSDLLQEIASLYEPRCTKRSVRFEFEIADSVTEISLNRRLLEIVLANLMDNATRFAAEGTACVVQVNRADADQGISKRDVRFEVTDRGAGIPLADQSRIFERFYQVSQSRTRGGAGGTGLGLSIVKHAVQLLGGRVGVESILHKGSTFWVEVPEDQPCAQGA